MLAPFLTPPYLPFAIAFVVMIGIGLIEAIGLGLGSSISMRTLASRVTAACSTGWGWVANCRS